VTDTVVTIVDEQALFQIVEEITVIEVIEEVIVIEVIEEGEEIEVPNEPTVVEVLVAGSQGARGIQGPPGDNTGAVSTKSYESDHPGTLYKGMAVCVIGGKLRRATCVYPYNKVIGLVYEDELLQGVVGRVQTDGNIDTTALLWEEATDMVGGLATGETYYLTDSGAIQPFAPTTPGQYVTPVGTALDSTTLRIELNPSVLL
jgi:hypothetical protein